MKIYIKKSNTDLNKEFIIPKNASFNCKNWVHIIVNEASKKFTAERLTSIDIEEDKWEVKENFTFPSSLLNEFLRNDNLDE